MTPFTRALEAAQDLINPVLEAHLPAGHLAPAHAHAVVSGGKRLRPFLLLEAARLCGAAARSGEVIRAAAAVEYVHIYSLVHDDLPSMDDGQLRHGRAALHLAFGEAAAILVGDALLTRAFELIPEAARGVLARAASAMVEGQARDISARGLSSQADLIEVYRLKTGALLSAASEIGACLAGASQARCRALARFGLDLGVAFQLADDLLGDDGKRSLREGGLTALSLGAARARILAAEFVASAKAHLEGLDAPLLLAAADFAINREN